MLLRLRSLNGIAFVKRVVVPLSILATETSASSISSCTAVYKFKGTSFCLLKTFFSPFSLYNVALIHLSMGSLKRKRVPT